MESFHLKFDNDAEFDKAVHGNDVLPQASPVSIITKHGATLDGRAGAVLAFDVQLPDGSVKHAQAVTTVRLLRTALFAFLGAYDDEGRPTARPTTAPRKQ